jgi:hypothetical protein
MKSSSRISMLAIITLLALIAFRLYTTKSGSEAHPVLDTGLRRHHSKGVGPIQRRRRPIRLGLRGQHRHSALLDQHPLRWNPPGRSRSSPHPGQLAPVAQAFLPVPTYPTALFAIPWLPTPARSFQSCRLQPAPQVTTSSATSLASPAKSFFRVAARPTHDPNTAIPKHSVPAARLP